ncbi:hypothetical protein Q7C36_012161 [Tachysurus vachellii]|uniref:Uncharacterized protein n=1 Tax=Tachysurus vachellii TaxID=175792 RepID=A0AA88MNZ8_TACVA|nr:hypothetical protein Q7C36_012161 [Tachysurus vachellii]
MMKILANISHLSTEDETQTKDTDGDGLENEVKAEADVRDEVGLARRMIRSETD